MHKQLYRQKLESIIEPKLVPKTSELLEGQGISGGDPCWMPAAGMAHSARAAAASHVFVNAGWCSQSMHECWWVG